MVNNRKVALILSGGGAKGAFEAAVEKYAREVKGYSWDIIAGVSVGALNGVMLAMGKYQRLWQTWNTISDDKVYTGGFNVLAAIKILFGAKSFYGNKPMQKLLNEEFDQDEINTNLLIGSVSLVSGEYVVFDQFSPNLKEAVLASTVMPVIWTPVDISPEYMSMVDGGVRNITPIGDILKFDPDEVVVINCGAENATPLPKPPANIKDIGLRTLDILLNELFVNDMHEFMKINALVKEAQAQGITLHNPSNGKPLKYFDCKIIEPDVPLGDTLDFSQEAVQNSIKIGERRAREIFGS